MIYSNLYFNCFDEGMFTDFWSVFGGINYNHDQTKAGILDSDIDNSQNSYHAKLKFKHRFSNRFKLNFGAVYFSTHFNEDYQDDLWRQTVMRSQLILLPLLQKQKSFYVKNWH